MNRIKQMAGVTLLEIMLVLAIASMIIVMSIRYYQGATAGQQANSALSQIQGIVAAADNLAQATGSYTAALGKDPAASLAPLLPGNAFNTPWGTTITLTAAASTLTFKVEGIPTAVCPLLATRLLLNSHFKMSQGTPAGCSGDQTFIYSANA